MSPRGLSKRVGADCPSQWILAGCTHPPAKLTGSLPSVNVATTQRELSDREDCPCSQKVRSKLDKLDLDYDETLVPDKHSERTDVEDRTGQTVVPVLFDQHLDEAFLADSDEIVRYLERQYA